MKPCIVAVCGVSTKCRGLIKAFITLESRMARHQSILSIEKNCRIVGYNTKLGAGMDSFWFHNSSTNVPSARLGEAYHGQKIIQEGETRGCQSHLNELLHRSNNLLHVGKAQLFHGFFPDLLHQFLALWVVIDSSKTIINSHCQYFSQSYFSLWVTKKEMHLRRDLAIHEEASVRLFAVTQ